MVRRTPARSRTKGGEEKLGFDGSALLIRRLFTLTATEKKEKFDDRPPWKEGGGGNEQMKRWLRYRRQAKAAVAILSSNQPEEGNK